MEARKDMVKMTQPKKKQLNADLPFFKVSLQLLSTDAFMKKHPKYLKLKNYFPKQKVQ